MGESSKSARQVKESPLGRASANRRPLQLALLFFSLQLFSSQAVAQPISGSAAAELSLLDQRDRKAFDGSRALRHLQRLVRKGNRYYGAPEREAVIALLTEGLQKCGAAEVKAQRFFVTERMSGQRYQLANLIARVNPEREERILLGTHWDTRLWAEEEQNPSQRTTPIPGANDGTSGVVVLFELLRALRSNPLRKIGVDVALFDGEEFGRPGSHDYCMGSKYMAKNLSVLYQRPPSAVIVIDMVGDKDLSFPAERSSLMRAPSLEALVRRAGLSVGSRAFQTRKRGPWITDDHSPFQALGIPAILLIDYDYPFWHTQRDTPSQCSSESLAQTGRALLAALRRIDLMRPSRRR
ncbi:MAG: M28 family peptidase [Myxococcota bacterium]|nr:M28 family peptidase [Myxococcota bacterium]